MTTTSPFLSLTLLILTITWAATARVFNEEEPVPTTVPDEPTVTHPTAAGGATSAAATGVVAGNAAQNNGNNPINNGFGGVSVLNGGQLPSGNPIQKSMFGTLAVIDDDLTEGHELGSGLIGKAQGFYVASSVDGNSQTLVFTAMFERGGYADSISCFGVHRTDVSESQLAIMGGTGKYLNAKGYAIVKTIPVTNQHETDGFETLLQLTVYLA